MNASYITLQLLPEPYAVCKLATLPVLQTENSFVSLSITSEEISFVCPITIIPHNPLSVETGWRTLKILGVLEFSQVGIIAGISLLLADAKISLFVVSTFNTDYILVKEENLVITLTILKEAGYRMEGMAV
jgi:uncharacterized protein